MGNHEKLKTSRIVKYELKPTPASSPPMTKEQFVDACRRVFADADASNKKWLQERGFPTDVFHAVRVAMADLFGEFVTDEEIGEYSTSQVWDLLQAAYDRRQWLAKTASKECDNWLTITQVANGLGINKGQVTRLVDRGRLRDNGKTGTPRRIDPASVLEYCDREGIAYNDT